jgi:hypothetical protein
MKNKVLLLLLAAVAGLMAFSAINLTGKWTGHLLIPHSTDSATFVYDLQQTNDTLTGSIIGPDGGGTNIYNGKVTGNKFSFSIAEAYGEAKIAGTYYGDSLGSNITFPSGKTLHLTLMHSK